MLVISRQYPCIEFIYYLQGIFSTPKLDFNALDHAWTKVREPGKMLWSFEVHAQKKTLFCINFETSVVPA